MQLAAGTSLAYSESHGTNGGAYSSRPSLSRQSLAESLEEEPSACPDPDSAAGARALQESFRGLSGAWRSR